MIDADVEDDDTGDTPLDKGAPADRVVTEEGGERTQGPCRAVLTCAW